YHAHAGKALSQCPAMDILEQRTGVPKNYLATTATALTTLLVSLNELAAPDRNLIGWGSPANLSMKVIQSLSGRDDVQWLTYWVIFGFLTYPESFALRILLYYSPWYFAAKAIFVIWFQLPQPKGAATLYHAATRLSIDRARAYANSTTHHLVTSFTHTATTPAGHSVGFADVY
ncbi:hypothetical protein BDV93DRAFT_454984, partial [Ceratobasidium sp. AG-I]